LKTKPNKRQQKEPSVEHTTKHDPKFQQKKSFKQFHTRINYLNL